MTASSRFLSRLIASPGVVYSLSDVQAWMGHADIQTTMRYVWHVPKHDAAERLGRLLDDENVAPNLAPNARLRRSQENIEHA